MESLIGRPGSKLRALLRVTSVTGAATFSLLVGGMAFTSASALAAGPPEIIGEVMPWTGSVEARVEAVVNPNEVLTECHVQYGKTTVTEHEVACEQATIEGGEQVVGKNLAGLTAASTYHYQFVFKNTSSEEAIGVEEQFETLVAEAPTVLSENFAANFLGSFEARVEGIVDPGNQATACHIQYGKTTVTEHEVACEPPELEGPFATEVGVGETLTGLTPATKYHYRIVLKDVSSKTATGPSEEFETAPVEAPTVIEDAFGTVSPSEARMEGVVNPNHQVTECHFQYGKTGTGVTENEASCEQASLTEFVEQRVGLPMTGLTSGTKYEYEIILKNASGEEAVGPVGTFETVAAPSEVETGGALAITATSAQLTGKLNAGGEATSYFEYGTAPCVTGVGATCGERVGETSAGGRTQEAVTPVPLEFPNIGTPLKPNTTYHYWLVANNGAVTEPVHGEEMEFTTLDFAPSQIEIGSPEHITLTSAVLTGKLNPGGEASYYIEYGPAQCSGSTCGQKTPERVLSGEAQASIAPFALSGLKPNTVYHYWLVATNNGTSQPVHGEANAFKTPATAAETEAEVTAKKAAEAEATAEAAAKSKLEEEAKHREEAIAATTAAQNKKYEEIAAVTASSKRQEEALKRQEELIDATSVKITKVKVTSRGVTVTFRVSEAGNVTLAGTDLKKKTFTKVAPGTHTVTLTLSGAGKAARKHHKKATVTVTLDTSLTSVAGSTTVRL
jgi:catabolite regulation protein CreA